jgi:SPP1 gp7 family putative phage head morphogenesis protein
MSYKTQLAITDKYARQLKRAYKSGIKDSQAQTDWDWVAKNIPYGYQAVYNAIIWHSWWPIPTLSKAYNNMRNTMEVKKESGVINPEDFMLPNPAAEQWMLRYAASEVTGILDKDKEMLRNVIYEGQRDLKTNKETAERIKEHLGLTEGQEKAVDNYRKALVKQGKTTAQIDKLTRQYYAKLLDYRAETISITESHTATSQAWIDYTQDAYHRGALQGYELEWLATPSDRTCPICMGMNRKTGSIESGTVEGSKPPIHARCRCVLITKRI